MIHESYLKTVQTDLMERVTDGDILLNDLVSIPVNAAKISSHPIAGMQNVIALQVSSLPVVSVPVIKNAKLRTRTGAIVAEKDTVIEMNGAQFMTIAFVIQVKGAV